MIFRPFFLPHFSSLLIFVAGALARLFALTQRRASVLSGNVLMLRRGGRKIAPHLAAFSFGF